MWINALHINHTRSPQADSTPLNTNFHSQYNTVET